MIADCWTCGLCPCHGTDLLSGYCLSLRVPLADSASWLCYLGMIGQQYVALILWLDCGLFHPCGCSSLIIVPSTAEFESDKDQVYILLQFVQQYLAQFSCTCGYKVSVVALSSYSRGFHFAIDCWQSIVVCYLVPGSPPCPEVVAVSYIRQAEDLTLFSFEGDAQVKQKNHERRFLTICQGHPKR